MTTISPGKLRGLHEIADDGGFFIICAADHRDSLRRMLGGGDAESVSHQDMVDFKLDLTRAVRPYASAVLLDPIYGAHQALAAGVIPGRMGLVVSTEATGYEGTPTARETALLDGWSVAKIKRMGASAAKVLLYYNPDNEDIAARQRAVLEGLVEDCLREDIAIVVEPVSYPLEGQPPEEYAREKPRIVVETARQMTQYPIDVLKAEFPADVRYEQDEATLLGYCRELDATTPVPWVLLSAGVDFGTFKRQVEIASRAGASGFLVGRALWQEAAALRTRAERAAFFERTAGPRLGELAEIARRLGAPWGRKYGAEGGAFPQPPEGWHLTY
jgi:tagatose 1,6-diphosphate aldolase